MACQPASLRRSALLLRPSRNARSSHALQPLPVAARSTRPLYRKTSLPGSCSLFFGGILLILHFIGRYLVAHPVGMQQEMEEVFCCSAHEDEAFLKELIKRLRPLAERGIMIWYDGLIPAGTERKQEIEKHLKRANIFLMLVSPDFFSSDACREQMQYALDQCEERKTTIIPILLRLSPHWEKTSLGKFQPLPKNGKNEKPVKQWPDRDNAWSNIVQGIEEAFVSVTPGIRPDPVLRRYFDHLIVTHTQLFAGREEIIATIHNYIDENRGGYIFIEGLSGYGKTSLLAKIVQNRPEIAYHFISQAYSTYGSGFHPTELEWLVRSLCEQLEQGGSEDFNGLSNPHDRFHRLLRTPSLNKAKVIVIDGVDEVDRLPNYLYGLLPTQLPPGVFLLFSARTLGRRNYLAEIGLTSESIQLQINLPGLDTSAIHQLLNEAGGYATQYSSNEPFIQKLSSISEGDPFYLRFLIEDVAKGKVRPDNQLSIPSGLEAYLDKQFEILARSAYLPQQRMLLGLVIEAHGPLSKDELIAMVPDLDGINFDVVIRDIHRFLLEYNNMFTLCHRRFKEYFYQKINGKED